MQLREKENEQKKTSQRRRCKRRYEHRDWVTGLQGKAYAGKDHTGLSYNQKLKKRFSNKPI